MRLPPCFASDRTSPPLLPLNHPSPDAYTKSSAHSSSKSRPDAYSCMYSSVLHAGPHGSVSAFSQPIAPGRSNGPARIHQRSQPINRASPTLPARNLHRNHSAIPARMLTPIVYVCASRSPLTESPLHSQSIVLGDLHIYKYNALACADHPADRGRRNPRPGGGSSLSRYAAITAT